MFINGIKRYSNTNVRVEDGMVIVTAKHDGSLIETYTLLEEVSDGLKIGALDIVDPQRGAPHAARFVAVVGCGCGGVPRYPINAEYSGRLP